MFPSLSIDTIQQIFDSHEWPGILAITPTESGYILDLFINQDIHWLVGHFPEQALVAGVVQTHWASKFAQRFFAIKENMQQIDNLKFQDVLLPGQTIQLALEFNAAKNSVKFCYYRAMNQHQNDTVFSEGKISFLCNDSNAEKML